NQVAHCMTRLRLSIKDDSLVNLNELKRVDGVMGVIEDDTLQIVVGPGTVNKVAAEMSNETGLAIGEMADIDENDMDFEEKAALKKAKLKEKNKTPFKLFLRRVGNIFIPLIPGLVASGIINGAANFAKNAGVDATETWMQILLLLGSTVFAYLAILVGWNTAKEFGGTPVLGAIAGGILFNPMLADIVIYGEPLVVGRGGLFGVIFAAWLMTFVEKNVRKVMHSSVDILFTPLITLLVVGFFSLYAVVPVAGLLSDGIMTVLTSVLDVGGVLAGGVLARFFLPLVMLGLHHGLTLIHLELMTMVGATGLLRILALGCGGVVGATIAVFIRSKNQRLIYVIKGALPVGFLGIGDPLLYGMTLRLGRPFI